MLDHVSWVNNSYVGLDHVRLGEPVVEPGSK